MLKIPKWHFRLDKCYVYQLTTYERTRPREGGRPGPLKVRVNDLEYWVSAKGL
jgi:hypothetical protein